MLKKVAMLLGVFGAAAVLTGCSSLQTASVADFNKQEVVTSGTAVEHIAVATHGLYLFSIPLITGSTDQYGMPTLVTDTVSPQALTAAVTKQAKAAGARTTADLVTDVTSAGFIFYYRGGTASGTAVKYVRGKRKLNSHKCKETDNV